MPHGRHDYPNALHLVRVKGRVGDAIFFPVDLLHEYTKDWWELAPDLQRWESLVARACDRSGAKVHGYTWLPNEAILLLQRFAVPLRIILPSLVGQYSRYLHAVGRIPQGESPYLGRCQSIQVTPELLPYALRHVYAIAVRSELCESPSQYPFCSYHLHFSEATPPWFETQEFLARVGTRGYVGRLRVEQFLAKPEGPRHAKLFEQLSARTAPIAGEATDVEESRQLTERAASTRTIEEVTEAVATLLHRASRSSERVLAMALTAWYGTRIGVATLAQLGHWFDRGPTTLRADIESHRKTSAALFELTLEEFDELIQTRPFAVAGAGTRPDIGLQANTLPSASSASISRARPVHRAPNTPQRGGSIAPFECRSVCMISNEDTARLGSEGDPDVTVLARRRKHRGR